MADEEEDVESNRRSLIDNPPERVVRTKNVTVYDDKRDTDQRDDADDDERSSERDVRSPDKSCGRLCKTFCRKSARWCAALLGEDWIYLVALGVLMGVFSFAIDACIFRLRNLHFLIFDLAGAVHEALQYAAWVSYTLVLVLISAFLCHYVAPQAAGSGIPEMKTILRGVVLKEYLTFRTLVVKFFGLILALGSGLPIGKEGPFVHIASMIARLLSHFAVSFKGIFENESRHSEMLAAACAVGVASTYGAPVGGVLFSIEVTSVFFPLRNYWRGFLATVCSAITFRLLAVWFQEQTTVVAFSPTSFPSDYPFDPKELFVFAFIGIACGFAGAFFVWIHRKYVTVVLQNGTVRRIREKCPLLYPAVLVFVLASLKCPLGYGHYFAGGLTPRQALTHLFSNFSWLDTNDTDYASNSSREILEYWADGRDIFATLALYALNMFWMTAVAITLPVPSGVFIPVFVTGAAFGRMVGEAMALLFPQGVRTDGEITKIVPGAYAIVGACSFSGAITHALSTSVVVVEITGQILYILPTILGVLLANAVCTKLQPSIYDSIICVKKLPYIPAIPPVSSGIHKIYVQDIMVKGIKYLSLESTFGELQDLLISMPKLKTFPLVDRRSSMILLGSIRRDQLQTVVERHVGEKARRAEAMKRRYSSPSEMSLKCKSDTEEQATVPVDVTPRSGAQRKLSRFTVRRVKSNEQIVNEKDLTPKPMPKVDSGGRTPLLTPNGQNVESSTLTYSKLVNTVHSVSAYVNALPNKFRQSLRRGPNLQNAEADVDLNDEDRTRWETEKLNERLAFDLIRIDPAPFQLVERTSLYRVHALFWLLGLNRAYVTSLGRLIGVVALRELRSALERAQPSAKVDKSEEKRMKLESDRKTLQSPPESTKDAGPEAKYPRPQRSISVNPTSCLVPNQLEALRISVPPPSPAPTDSLDVGNLFAAAAESLQPNEESGAKRALSFGSVSSASSGSDEDVSSKATSDQR